MTCTCSISTNGEEIFVRLSRGVRKADLQIDHEGVALALHGEGLPVDAREVTTAWETVHLILAHLEDEMPFCVIPI